ncbi:MAG: hypothetical protein U0934_15070 [Pseudotabrizicola sp.]|uniref:hypothetical protein n=1 Tax=Pseudotabrizicola sp. TaxID=2939647 RepID=UPI00273105F6|nr:hypothetical protein [Pseudotabrizicola sp.]MDP2081366.1 hypothetical protein [Pseudotabrizicola sp.]MDZ7575251.1 hypothetical protein [Pseudotabrizicola sp.]
MSGTEFAKWQKEKAVLALVEEAQAVADRLAMGKPHAVEMHAAAAQFWAAVYLAEGQDLVELIDWKPAEITRFIRAAQTKIAALRKTRDYTSSDGLAVWLHSARAVVEPRIAPAVRDIWAQLSAAGQNVESMLTDLLQDAGLPAAQGRKTPKGL